MDKSDKQLKIQDQAQHVYDNTECKQDSIDLLKLHKLRLHMAKKRSVLMLNKANAIGEQSKVR